MSGYLELFYIPSVEESIGSMVYSGDGDPHTKDSDFFIPNPTPGDRYLQTDTLTIIEWTCTTAGTDTGGLTDSVWAITSTVKFFIQTPNGVVMTANTSSLQIIATAEIGGVLQPLNSTPPYNMIKLYTPTTPIDTLPGTLIGSGYNESIDNDDVDQKYIVRLINTNNNDILDTKEIIEMLTEYDITPPDNTMCAELYTLI